MKAVLQMLRASFRHYVNKSTSSTLALASVKTMTSHLYTMAIRETRLVESR